MSEFFDFLLTIATPNKIKPNEILCTKISNFSPNQSDESKIPKIGIKFRNTITLVASSRFTASAYNKKPHTVAKIAKYIIPYQILSGIIK
jgi:hypothetical protein